MKKRAIALMLSAAFALSLAACGDTSTAEESKAPSEPSATTEDTPTPTPEAEDKEAYEITYSNVKTYTNSIGTTYAQVIVEIENTGTYICPLAVMI